MTANTPTTYTLPTTWERGRLRITTPRSRLDTGLVSWSCNTCGAGRVHPLRRAEDARAAGDEWHAHTCPPLPPGWMTAPAEMPCDTCHVHTRTRCPKSRPLHPTCPPAR
ncbi:hypothetical protein [Embleya sp. NPDC020630]|uniref:hypothetical protein n=1 Tax=Embleya sp. NPDC020630 TaxID=3363979 RepID=UPI0037B0B39B